MVFLMLTTIAFAGCQESNPSRTIVSMQIDSDGEIIWIYLYTVPRVKMGNFTINFTDDSETLASVFSHQRSISNAQLAEIQDSESYFDLSVRADMKGVYWDYTCKIKISPSELEDDLFLAEIILMEGGEEKQEVWELPYNVPLEYAT